MLEHLFGSRTRVKLLSLFLRHPDEPMFVREITRKISTQINAVRRELSNLVHLGLIKEVSVTTPELEVSKERGLKKKYYQVNQNFTLFQELTSLVIKAQVLLEQKLDREILKMGDVRYLAFLGSFLGIQKAPVDLFIIGTINKKSLQQLIASCEKELGFEINFSTMTFEEYLYRKDITDKFLYGILEGKKNVVIDRLSERL
ncbi:hypothetical protein EXS71_01275 [Candidatus Uhrbacteria bacterium]|nr:hypothetical protein [Candidatus Uhrbacteria bacterium]